MESKLPITAIVAARNEAANIARCVHALAPAERVVVVDSQSGDATPDIARAAGAEVVPFRYSGGYPRKRQWAMDNLPITSGWILLVDADEEIPPALWQEIEAALSSNEADAFLIRKGFHFMGRRLRFGGFSHSAVILFRRGVARFEELFPGQGRDGLDMEVHERILVDGRLEALRIPLIHNDFKGIDAYIEKHRQYARWEAEVRLQYIREGTWGGGGVRARLLGNVQERRRFLKGLVLRMPFEPALWFVYHYVLRLGFLEGRAGFVAARIRARYIFWVRRELGELLKAAGGPG